MGPGFSCAELHCTWTLSGILVHAVVLRDSTRAWRNRTRLTFSVALIPDCNAAVSDLGVKIYLDCRNFIKNGDLE